MIKDEFGAIVDALVQAAHTHLKTLQAAALRKSTLIYMGLVEFLQEQNRARLARTRVLLSAGDTLRKTELRRNRQARVAELVSEIPVMELLLRRLEKIDRTWAEQTS